MTKIWTWEPTKRDFVGRVEATQDGPHAPQVQDLAFVTLDGVVRFTLIVKHDRQFECHTPSPHAVEVRDRTGGILLVEFHLAEGVPSGRIFLSFDPATKMIRGALMPLDCATAWDDRLPSTLRLS